MIWLNPLAWIGLAVLVSPILIHILVQRRAERFPFPTLRFIQPTRLAAIRRHLLDDLPLLIVRAGVLAAAVGALAGPLVLTPARRQTWNARTVRATVVDRGTAGADEGRPLRAVFRAQTFETADLRDGVRRATAWLESAPPARRELEIVAPLALGSITRADLGDVPSDVGIRLQRSAPLATARSFRGSPVLRSEPAMSGPVETGERTIELSGPSTSVRESRGAPAMVPIEIVAPPGTTPRAANQALAAVLSVGVFAPRAGRTALVLFAGSPGFDEPATTPVSPMQPWIADAVARIAGDARLQSVGANGKPLIAATGDGSRLVVRTSAPATDVVTLRLLRSVLNALAQPIVPVGDGLQAVPYEILPIPDVDLRAWERPAGEVRTPRLDTLDRDDRRWWWAAALVLLALEAWIRRVRADSAELADPTSEEAARVA